MLIGLFFWPSKVAQVACGSVRIITWRQNRNGGGRSYKMLIGCGVGPRYQKKPGQRIFVNYDGTQTGFSHFLFKIEEELVFKLI